MATKITQAAAKAACDAVVDLVDGGAGAGYVEIRTGAAPANANAAATGTVLGTVTFSDPAFGNATTASPSVATANAITSDTNADASGTAGWFRVYDSAGTGIWDGSITATGGGGDLELDNTSVVAGGTIALSSFVYRQPTA